MIRPLLNQYDVILKSKCANWNFNNSDGGYTTPDGELHTAESLFEDLRDTMQHNKGLGLSAPQIGINSCVFVLGNPGDTASIKEFFNPMVVDILGEDVYIEEGCLSFPGMFVKVKRPRAIRIRATDRTGDTTTYQFEGLTAHIFLHELDHLNGITFLKRASPFHIDRARSQMKKLNRRKNKMKGTHHE